MKHRSTNFSLSKTDSLPPHLVQLKCAWKRARIYKAAFAITCLAFISACQRHEQSSKPSPTQDVALPADKDRKAYAPLNVQAEFEALRGKLRLPYSNAKNEIIKSSIFNAANKNVDDFLSTKGTFAKSWTGEIETLSTSHGGKDAWLVVRSFDGTTYRMSDIDSNSELYRELASLQEGQPIIFSGYFQKTASGSWEISLTERGSLNAPEYSFVFETIKYFREGSPSPSIQQKIKSAPTVADSAQQAEPDKPPFNASPLPQEILDLDPVGVALRTPASSRQSNGARGNCNLLVGMLFFTVVERDHGIELKKSQKNIVRVLEGMEVSEGDIEVWQNAAETIHVTQISGEQLKILNKRCEKIPSQ